MAASSAAIATAGRQGPGAGSPLMTMRGIGKVYPGSLALSDVDLDIHAGAIHTLVGENGAGKSTLLKIACGAVAPTEGLMALQGTPIRFDHPMDARASGIAAVHQELTIIPSMSAVANVFLGREKSRAGFIDGKAMARDFGALARQLEVDVRPEVRAGSLSIADQQSLEIMRGLAADAKILILDEPTASIGSAEREALYSSVRRLRARGVAILLISHDMDEVFSLSDHITVLRGGQVVGSRAAGHWTRDALIAGMLGDKPVAGRAARERRMPLRGEAVVEVCDVRVPGKVHGISARLEPGEILGIAGLVGSGRTEFLRALVGMEPGSSGTLAIEGQRVRWLKSPRDALQRGIALAPEDRKREGLVLGLPSYANITLTNPWPSTRLGLLSPASELARAAPVSQQLALQAGVLRRPARTLSGGNQQKLVLAKWLDAGVKVLLVDEPTRGVDIGAKAELFAVLDKFARSGVAVVLVSSELEEVAAHADRILVFSKGSVIGELDGHGATKENILNMIFAAEKSDVR